jgi:hypothetical protein
MSGAVKQCFVPNQVESFSSRSSRAFSTSIIRCEMQQFWSFGNTTKKHWRVPRKNFLLAIPDSPLPKANGSLSSSLSEEWRNTGSFPVLLEGGMLQDWLPARTT